MVDEAGVHSYAIRESSLAHLLSAGLAASVCVDVLFGYEVFAEVVF
ncbi:hypothetical protein [Paeniglutamicibacter gangotriensis]|nr:hypothetical protein [Paeniglutamicibacter gangotriensis]